MYLDGNNYLLNSCLFLNRKAIEYLFNEHNELVLNNINQVNKYKRSALHYCCINFFHFPNAIEIIGNKKKKKRLFKFL